MFKKLLLPALLALSLGATVLPAVAADVALSINVAPPPLRIVAEPAPRVGYRWSPGYWNLRNHRHVWTNGVWMRERPGYVYTEPTWTQSEGNWHLKRGAWMRHDKDADGLPNKLDAHPANTNRP